MTADVGARTPARVVEVRAALVVLLGAGLLAGVLAAGAPTGLVVFDALLRAACAAAVVLLSTRAGPAAWGFAGVVVVVSAGPEPVAVAGATVVFVAVVSAVRGAADGRTEAVPSGSGSTRLSGAVVGLVLAVALARLGGAGRFGLTALAVVVAVTPLAVSAHRRARPHERELVGSVVRWCALVVSVPLGCFFVALVAGSASLERGLDQVREATASARNGDPEAARQAFDGAARSFHTAERVFTSPWVQPARLVPLVGRHLDALAEGSDVGEQLAGEIGSSAGLASFAELQAGPGAVDLEALRSYEEPLSAAAAELAAASVRLADHSEWLVPWLASRLDDLRVELAAAGADADLAAQAVSSAPELLGADEARHYLVLVASPAETRELGGFVANYLELRADGGVLSVVRSGRASDLNDESGERALREPDRYPTRYLALHPERYWQNVTGSPDFPTVAVAATDLYEQSTGTSVDGVVYVDPEGLAGFLALTGPVRVPGLDEPLSADNAVDVLLREQYVLLADKAERVEVLEQAGEQVFRRLTGLPVPGPRRVVDALGPAAARGRLLVHLARPDEQELFDRIGMGGAFPTTPPGDLLSVVHVNANPSKIDAYLRREVTYDVEVDPRTGAVDAVVTAHLRNDAPAGGLPDYVIGAADPAQPPGTNRMLLSIYSPHELVRAELDGVSIPLEDVAELGVRRYSAFVDVPPGGTRIVRVHLEGSVRLDGVYRLDLAPQPVAGADDVTVRVRAPATWRLTDPSGSGVGAVVDDVFTWRSSDGRDQTLEVGLRPR
ncbi:MAG: DUF4012 domain-containing protein [Acidimicrobiales bacterium]|nr:DUF4012 domain-containing protein [Acidimicrobiales bacterium]